MFAFLLDYALRVHLRRAELVSGLTLFAFIVILTLFNARKKLPFLPLLRASTWLQIHIYAGLLSCVMFGLHVGWKLPRGVFESILAVLFCLVSASGLAGLAFSRWSPGRLTVHGENVIFERIPALRTALRHEVEEMVADSIAKSQSSTISDYYETKLRNYFSARRYLWHHLLGNNKPLFKLLSEAQALDRYFNAEERVIMARIVEKIQAKNNLDFQQVSQGLLKGWLFVHIPLTYAMILAATVHGIMAWKFS
ncbi:MAG TPA: hypothetical protein VG754_01770 [Verrucomicrobiae bacterium]|nr:hypothetical protein [Verrucomicrobiae bacterium]